MAATISGIPVYEALVNSEDTGMVRISLVDDPAVITTWQKFNNAARLPQLYAVADEERRIVRGVVMRADFPIYRRDTDRSTGAVTEYYLIYHADTIRAMAEKYLAEDRANNVDTMHNGKEVDGVQMVQWYIKDTAAGINPQGFDTDIADGSLFAEFHIINDDVWAQVKDGTFRGFSLEGYFAFAPERDPRSVDDIVNELAAQFHITDMSKLNRIKELLRAENDRQEKKPGRPEKFGAVTTDRGPLEWDGDADLAVDDRVYVVDEDGNRTDAPTGEYSTETQIIVVEDGTVTEIRDKEEPEDGEEAEVTARRQRFQNLRQFFEQSYEDKINAIVAAIVATRGNGDWYVQECGDDFAIIRSWEGESEKLYRYAITWNEDGTAVASDPQEVEETYVPVDGGTPEPSEAETELRSQLDTRTQELNDANARITTLTAELEAARKLPLGRPAHEEFKASASKPEKTGNKQLDRVGEIMSAK